MNDPLVTLFMPKREKEEQRTSQKMPLELLALAGPLLESGYKVELIDANVQDNYSDLLSEACRGSVCLGISCILGYQIVDGFQEAQKMRQRYPSLPIVWGGWFPSVVPQLFLDEGVADLVVIGQGEKTFLEVVDGISTNGTREVPGTVYKSNGQLTFASPRQITQLEDLPSMPFNLLDYETYFRSDPKPIMMNFWSMAKQKLWPKQYMRLFTYVSSWGCPQNCGFCCSAGVTKRRWTGLSPQRILDDLGALVEEHQLDSVNFCDANFFVDRKRILEMCAMKEDRGLDFSWSGWASPETVTRMTGSELERISKSGCFGMFTGAESGSEETLKAMNKRHLPKDNELCTELLVRHQIAPIVSYVVGIPGESADSINETIQQARRIKAKHVDVMVLLWYYMPLPGSGLYQQALEEGFSPPKSFEEWGELGKPAQFRQVSFFHRIAGPQKKTVHRLNMYSSLVDIPWFNQRLGMTEKVLRRTALMRIKLGFFFLPLEPIVQKVMGKVTRVVRRFANRLSKNKSAQPPALSA